MTKLDASIGEHLADEKPTVAVVRVALAAHQSNPMPARTVGQARRSGPERLLLGHRSVQGVAVGVVVVLVRGTAAELLAHEEVADTATRHLSLERITVEVRRVARVRVGPHIDEDPNLLAQDEPSEVVDVMVRVAYGPDSEARRHDDAIVGIAGDDTPKCSR